MRCGWASAASGARPRRQRCRFQAAPSPAWVPLAESCMGPGPRSRTHGCMGPASLWGAAGLPDSPDYRLSAAHGGSGTRARRVFTVARSEVCSGPQGTPPPPPPPPPPSSPCPAAVQPRSTVSRAARTGTRRSPTNEAAS